jgi:hypothetical protein
VLPEKIPLGLWLDASCFIAGPCQQCLRAHLLGDPVIGPALPQPFVRGILDEASSQVNPPSTLISTRVISPSPLDANPRIIISPVLSLSPSLGSVMTLFTPKAVIILWVFTESCG